MEAKALGPQENEDPFWSGEDPDALISVCAERLRQTLKWGVQNHPQRVLSLPIPTAAGARLSCDARVATGLVGWADIIFEEFCEYVEACAESKERTREELVQLAACCVAAIESLDRSK